MEQRIRSYLNLEDYKRFRALAKRLGDLTDYALVKKAVKEFMENTNAQTNAFLMVLYSLAISACILVL